MNQVNRMWLSDEALCIEVDRETLDEGSTVTLTVRKAKNGYFVRSIAEAVEEKCDRFCCADCPCVGGRGEE